MSASLRCGHSSTARATRASPRLSASSFAGSSLPTARAPPDPLRVPTPWRPSIHTAYMAWRPGWRMVSPGRRCHFARLATRCTAGLSALDAPKQALEVGAQLLFYSPGAAAAAPSRSRSARRPSRRPSRCRGPFRARACAGRRRFFSIGVGGDVEPLRDRDDLAHARQHPRRPRAPRGARHREVRAAGGGSTSAGSTRATRGRTTPRAPSGLSGAHTPAERGSWCARRVDPGDVEAAQRRQASSMPGSDRTGLAP